MCRRRERHGFSLALPVLVAAFGHPFPAHGLCGDLELPANTKPGPPGTTAAIHRTTLRIALPQTYLGRSHWKCGRSPGKGVRGGLHRTPSALPVVAAGTRDCVRRGGLR